MLRLTKAGFLAAIALSGFTAGCGGAPALVPSAPSAQLRAAAPNLASEGAAGHITVTPLKDGYLRGDASGLELWGERPWDVRIEPAGESGTAGVTSSKPAVLAVTPAHGGNGRYTLTALTVETSTPACHACKVVQPGIVDLLVTVQGKKTRRYRVPVTIRHSVVAISLNPNPNPSLGGSDAVMQYYDDNAAPSVIWDDVVLRNASAFPNVGGLAFGPDGSLYIANSGICCSTPGTVTQYAAGSKSSTPVKTFADPVLLSAAAVALDARGNVYVADNGYETVSRFPAAGGPAVAWHPGWDAGAGVAGVAVDAQRGQLDVVMSEAGLFYPPSSTHVGRIAVLPLDFNAATPLKFAIHADGKNGVDEPYGIALDAAGRAYVVNDYVSIVEGPPGPGPEYSTLVRYDGGIASSSVRPNATVSRGLVWPLSVAVDVAGNVFVANNTPPTKNDAPGTMSFNEYGSGTLGFQRRTNVSATMPSAYGPYYFNIQGIAVDPSPLRR